MADAIIKTTARYQDTDEPSKQRPIIHIAPALPNTIRSSLDGGRDNPFRPDGAIYRSADPIVDYYKHGSAQSRGQSPTDSQLILNGSTGERQDRPTSDECVGATDRHRKSCLRRWLCCCCCCGCGRCFKGKEGEKSDEKAYAVVDATKANEMARVSRETYRTIEPVRLIEPQSGTDEQNRASNQIRVPRAVVVTGPPNEDTAKPIAVEEQSRESKTAPDRKSGGLQGEKTEAKSRCLLS